MDKEDLLETDKKSGKFKHNFLVRDGQTLRETR